MGKIIRLEKLECNQTSEIEVDECYLIVYIDSVNQHSFRMRLSAGQTWYINESYPFQDQVEVKLFDEDYLGANDLLGTVSLSTEPTIGTIAVSFELNAAQYQLWYEVIDENKNNNFNFLLDDRLKLRMPTNGPPTPGPLPPMPLP